MQKHFSANEILSPLSSIQEEASNVMRLLTRNLILITTDPGLGQHFFCKLSSHRLLLWW